MFQQGCQNVPVHYWNVPVDYWNVPVDYWNVPLRLTERSWVDCICVWLGHMRVLCAQACT
jgi:hypothetical protein